MDGFLRCRSPAPRATASDPPTRPWRRSAHRPGRIPVWNRGHRLGQYYCPKSPCQILPRNTRVAMPCQCEVPAICFLAPGWEARRGPRPLSRRNVIALDARPGQWEFRPGPTGLRRILVITPAIAYGLDTCADKRRDRGCRSSGAFCISTRHMSGVWPLERWAGPASMPSGASCWRWPMSTKSSFREALGRRDATKERSRGRSAFPAVAVILVRDDIRQPVDFVRLLTRRGLSLRKAHDALSKLAAGESVELEFRTNKRDQLRS